MIGYLEGISGKKMELHYGLERKGDVKHSRADISKITQYLDYKPLIRFEDGLRIVYKWYKRRSTKT